MGQANLVFSHMWCQILFEDLVLPGLEVENMCCFYKQLQYIYMIQYIWKHNVTQHLTSCDGSFKYYRFDCLSSFILAFPNNKVLILFRILKFIGK